MARPIIRDPAKFDGAPHIEGTTITIDEIQEYWRQPGVGAVDIRKRYPNLTEAELGAAVTYREPAEPPYSFEAEYEGPPRRGLYIWGGDESGWAFAWNDLDGEGTYRSGGDNWEETYEAILRYPEVYAPRNVVWRDVRSGEIVDIYSLRPMSRR